MQATAERVMGGGFRRNSVSELKLKNRCTGSTAALVQNKIALSANVNLFHSGILPKTIKIITILLVDGWTVDHFT